MAEITVKHITKEMDNMLILDDISLQISHNEFVVLVGPSGCGKSTLFNIISGLLAPDNGSIVIDGEDCTACTGKVSYMQQKDLLLPSRNILDNVSIPLILKGQSKKQARETARPYLEDFGLANFAAYYPRQLSGGMRQRAALLRTYLFTQNILLLDEPFASLDAISRRKMQLWLKELRQRYQSSILFVTHDIDEALLLADRIYVFSARPARVRMEIQVEDREKKQDLNKIREDIITLLEKELGD